MASLRGHVFRSITIAAQNPNQNIAAPAAVDYDDTMKLGMWDYILAAFSARPIGMWVPPNWVGLGIFALLGAITPGFWLMGLGLELAYLYATATNSRFQRVVQAAGKPEARRQWQAKFDKLFAQLSFDDQHRYRNLERRCRTILEQLGGPDAGPELKAQSDGLSRLLWIYLRLLFTRQTITKVLGDSLSSDANREPLEQRVKRLEDKLKTETLRDDLRKSLSGQVEILRQRLEKQKEAREKLAFLESELTRIQEQAELIREQTVLNTDPEAVSHRIDQISETLGGTTQWISEQQKIYGNVEDLVAEPPPLAMSPQQTPAKESQ